MSEADKELERKHQALREKYKSLRRSHKKLAGVTLHLAEALETFLKNGEKPDISGVLNSCSEIYPGLITYAEMTEENTCATEMAAANDSIPPDALEEVPEEENNEEEEKSDKEYYEGFWSRPKIPRTPQI